MVDVQLRWVGEALAGVDVDPHPSDHVAAIRRQGHDGNRLSDQYLVSRVLAVAVRVNPVRPSAAAVRKGGQRGNP